MANEQKIDEIIDDKAYNQIERLDKELKELIQRFIELAKVANIANAAVSRSSLREFESNATRAAKTVEAARLAQLRAIEVEERIQRARELGAQRFEAQVQRELAAQARREQAAQRLSDREAKQTLRAQESQRAYAALDAEHKRLVKDAQDLGVVFGENSVEFREAANRANVLEARLRAIDETLRKNQRNVGNYGSAFNGLGNSINQITREFPAFANSVQTGFMAISNNLPIFFDEISRTREQIRAMRAEGQQVPSLFKQLMNSIFSWGTALSLGVTLLTLYGKEMVEFITAIFKGREAIDKFALQQKDLNEALKGTEFSNAIKNVNELTINIDLAKKGFLDKKDVLKQYNETIGDTTGEVKTLDEAEKQLVKNADSYIKFTLYKAAAQIALQKAAEKAVEAEEARRKSDLKSANGADKATTAVVLSPLAAIDAATRIFAQKSLKVDEAVKVDIKRRGKERKELLISQSKEESQAQIDIAKRFQEDAAKIAKANGFDFNGKNNTKDKVNTDEIDFQIQLAEQAKKSAEAIANNEAISLDTRYKAIEEFSKKSAELVELNKQKELRQEDLSASKIKAINSKAKFDLQTATTETSDLRIKVTKSANDKLKEILKEGLANATEAQRKEVSILTESNNDRLEEIERFRKKSTIKLNQQYAEGKISKKSYEEQLLAIERDAATASIQLQIDTLKKVIEIEEAGQKFGIGTSEQLKRDKKALSDLEIKLSKMSTDAQIKNLETLEEKRKRQFDQFKKLEQEAFELGKTLFTAGFENRINALEEESNAIDKKRKNDIEAVTLSADAEKEKADKIAIINAQADAQQQIIEQRQKQEKIKQARAEKAAAVSQAIINGALAMTKVNAQTGVLSFVFSPFIAAMTALQVATILAQPIPKYKSGTDFHPGGLAYVGDGGKSEMVINPDGSTAITPDTTTLVNMQRGAKVVNGDMLEKIRKQEFLPKMPIIQSERNFDLSPLLKELKAVKKSINNQKQFGTILTPKGLRGYMANQNEMEQYLFRNGIKRR